MKSYEKVVNEIVDIKRWLFTTIYSYTAICNNFSERIKSGELIKAEVDLAFNETGCNPYSLIQRLSTDNIKTCKELALIRSISALEVYTVDAVKEVFDANKSPFLLNSSIEYPLGEVLLCSNISVLHNRYIEQKCRNLHSGGFEEILKYYKQTFDIDFKKFSIQIEDRSYGVNFIQQYHQKRHLIIHRLGKTDEPYRKKFNSEDTTIKLYKSELSTFFNVALAFAHFIDQKMDKYILTPSAENKVEIEIEILDNDAKEYFEPTFTFHIRKREKIPLSSIMESKEFKDTNIIKIQLHGNFICIRRFHKFLLKKASSGILKVLSYNNLLPLPLTTRKIKQYPWYDVEKVLTLLPEKPWEKHIHKKIADQLGWSNNKVSGIIDNIVTERQVSINLGHRKINIDIGTTYTFPIKIVPEEFASEINWQTSNSDIATVENGTVTAVSPGYVDISARIAGNMSRTMCSVTVLNTN
jgi:hypothetical protein